MDLRRQKRERDSDLSLSPLQDSGMYAGDNDSKKARTGDGASRVVHIRNIHNGVNETEVIQLGLPFGKITNILMLKQKNQAFLEFENDSSAVTMVNYFGRSAQPMLGGRNVYVQFSQHKELKTDASHSNANAKSQAALEAARTLLDGGALMDDYDDGYAEQGSVLHVTIENMVYPVTLETLTIIFKKYGAVQKILTFTKNNQFQALVQYASSRSADDARFALHGQNIYNGCCNLRVENSKLSTVNVKYNNERAWDFTNPNLPSGDGQMGGMGAGAGVGSGSAGMMGFSPHGQGPPPMMGQRGSSSGLIGMGMNMNMNVGNNQMMEPTSGQGGCVLLVSNLEESCITPDNLFTLFGVYGDVLRVKILYNKKDTALIQMSDPWMAEIARQHLDKIVVWGKPVNVRTSKHANVAMPRDDQSSDGSGLTKDFSNSPLHRYKKAGSKNCSNIFKPSTTLHLSNIAEGVTEEELADAFKEHGSVDQFKFFTGNQKMALLAMGSTEEAVIALIHMHNRQFKKQYLRVSFSKSPMTRT